jgi:probable F420-dependent oxidoreductase
MTTSSSRNGVLLALGTYDHPCVSAETIVDTACMAEAAGFDGVIVAEHVVMGGRTDLYPWGEFPGQPDDPWLEPMVTLSAIGAVTTRLRLCTGIFIAPLRPAALLAKSAATLDRMTGGRLELGVGTGWQREEFEAGNVDYDRRGAILTDTIAACRALWAPGPATFHSEVASFENIWCEPKPVREHGVRVLFSGSLTSRNLDRIVKLGDGWMPIMGMQPEEVAAGAGRLRSLFAEAGRDPDGLAVRGHLPLVRSDAGRPLLEESTKGIAALWADGITDVVIPLAPFVETVDQRREWFDEAARALAQVR